MITSERLSHFLLPIGGCYFFGYKTFGLVLLLRKIAEFSYFLICVLRSRSCFVSLRSTKTIGAPTGPHCKSWWKKSLDVGLSFMQECRRKGLWSGKNGRMDVLLWMDGNCGDVFLLGHPTTVSS